jgi:beta-glucanase (GH16 family)
MSTPTTLPGSDDFTGTTLNTALWGVYDGVNSGEDWVPGQVVVSGGYLNLNAGPEGIAGVAGTTNFTFGTFEVRARFSPSLDSNLAPVFLFWPELNSSWPAAGEIDYVECYDITRQSYQSWNHYAVNGVNTSDYAGSHKLDMTQWHAYRVAWTAESIVLSVDGTVWHTYTDHIPTGPMHPTFQINSLGAVTGSAQVQIDYFHVLAQ